MNVLIKSIFREIKNSIERYLAIFSIIALGVGFFAGLCVYRPALVNTAEKYLEEQKFYDYRILSSIGFSKNNTAPFSDLQNISSAEGAHYEDVLIAIGKNDLTFRVHSITNNINKLNIISGRLPETDSECVLDASFFDENMIGQTISFSDSNKEEIFSVLVRQICCHMAGDDEAIRVISLNPPAAIIFMMPSFESASFTRLTSEAAMT